MTVGEALSLIRKDAGLTLRAFADRLGMSHVHVCNVESGKASPSMEMLAAVREKFGYDPYLLAEVANSDIEKHRDLLRRAGK